VHLTCGILRDLQAFFWLRVFSTPQALSTPAHTPLTQTVGRSLAQHSISQEQWRLNLKYFLPIILTISLLSACGVPATQLPMPTETTIPTVIIPTATATLIPTPTLSPTPTEMVMPDFMKEFIESGYDKQLLDSDTIYVVLDEKATFYVGLHYNKSTIYSWTEAYYIENGTLQKGFIITHYCTENESGNAYHCYLPFAGNIRIENYPDSTNFSRGTLTQLHDLIIGDYPIVQIELNWQHFKKYNHGLPDSFFQDIYPPFTGKLKIINIPDIGDVIPATDIILDMATQVKK